MKKQYLIPQVTKQELRLVTQICSPLDDVGSETQDPNLGLAPGRLYL